MRRSNRLCVKPRFRSHLWYGGVTKSSRATGEYRVPSRGLEEEAIPLCAALSRQDGGDARRAITHLRKAGDLARTENADSVTTDHVERV